MNDEIESLKTDKKKLRAVLDEKEVSMKGKDEEIKNLEREVKTLIQVRPLFGIGHLINVDQQTLLPFILVPTAKAQVIIFESCLHFVTRTKSSDLHSLFVHLRASYSITTIKVELVS